MFTINCNPLRYILVKSRFFTILLLILSGRSFLYAQYDPSFSHYFDMETSFNAASAGKDEKLNVVGAYALALAGFENNPKTMYLSADMPFYALKSYHGVGIQLVNDQIGLFTHQRVNLQYDYKFALFGGTLSAGVTAGFINESFDFSKVDVEDSSDPAFQSSDNNGSGFDLGVGLYYKRKDWYVGISAQHVNAPLIEIGEKNELQIDATYYLTAGCNIRMRNPFLTIKPSLLVRSDGVGYRGDVTGRLVYTNDNKMMYGGVSYSPTNSVTFLIGGNVHGIVLGYSYEVYTSAISAGNGSHELFVGYQTDINLVKKGRNRHQSVRIL